MNPSPQLGEATAEDRLSLAAVDPPVGVEPDAFLDDAFTLLGEGDPGPTPFLVDDFLVMRSIAALVGAYKVGKTWIVLELATSVASGRPFLDRYEVARGPVMLILEESGRRALHRRLSMIVKARGIDRTKLSQLLFAANRGVKLSDPTWRARLLAEADRIRPMLIVFDPLARVKGGAVDESSQLEIGPVLDFLRELREVSGATVLFVHHSGHEARDRMRGSSDLESFWESKVSIRAADAGYEIRADHREAESSPPVTYRLAFAEDTMRVVLDESGDEHDALILDYLREHPGATSTEVRKGVPRRAAATSSRLLALEEAGTLDRKPSERPDKAGRSRRLDTFYLVAQAESSTVPPAGTIGTPDERGLSEVPSSPPYRGDSGRGPEPGART